MVEMIIKIPEEVRARLAFGVTYTQDIQTVCDAISEGSIKNLPSVTPKKETGYWIDISISGEIDGHIIKAYTCSKCGAISVFRMIDGKIINGDLCPNCGAEMIEPQKSEV